MSQLVMKQVRMRDLFFSEHDGSGTEVVLDQFADQADQIESIGLHSCLSSSRTTSGRIQLLHQQQSASTY